LSLFSRSLSLLLSLLFSLLDLGGGGGGVGGLGFSLAGAHMLNSAIQFCRVLMGTMHSTFLADVWRRKMSMNAITCTPTQNIFTSVHVQ
jgi:hypothetical protein